MGKRFSFELKIAGMLFIILALVIVTGIFAYQRFSGIVSEVSQDVRPDSRLIVTKALQNNLNVAEISVKSYRITSDTVYLSNFYIAVQAVDQELNRLHELEADPTFEYKTAPLTELDTLVSEKIYILNNLLLLQDGFRTQKALDKVVNEIERKQEVTTSEVVQEDTTITEEKERKLFGWLFKKKNKEEAEDTVSTTAQSQSDTIVSMETVNREVQAIKSQEFRDEQKFKQQELSYILEDQVITEMIVAILESIEEEEVQRIKKEAEKAEEVIRSTNRQIAYFCVGMGVLILFMAFVIINYVRNNNRYRIALKKSKDEAEELARMKEQFLANMSHEMRTPMNAVAGFSEQIAQGELSKTQRKQIGMVQKSADHLLHLINEVLDFSKLNADRIALEHIPFHPKELILSVAELLENEAQNKGLQTEIEIHAELPESAIGDPYRLRQILFNLIGNAIKFTENGKVSILAEPVMQSAKDFHLRIQIKDTGIGIAPKNIDRIFNEFEQATTSTTRNFGGTGLGLSIVKKLVDLHNGKIEVTSALGEGTNIMIELPYAIGDAPVPKETTAKTPTDVPFSNQHILIADDEEFNRLLITGILKKYDVRYTQVQNGKEVLQALNHHRYDLILMDIRMPEMNGMEATRAIRNRADEALASIPVIALTAGISEKDKADYKAAGMNGFLPKPFKENELLAELRRFLEPTTTDTKTMKEEPPVPSNEPTKVDLSQLKALSAGDEAFYLDMLQTFISGTEEGIENINQAVTDEKWLPMAEYAHKISAPCKMMGAITLYDQLKKIESNGRNNENLDEISEVIKKMNRESKTVIQIIQKEIQRIEEKASQ